jgi:ArsR family transcriptional regulator
VDVDVHEVFRALADAKRFRIFCALRESERCVRDLVDSEELAQPLVSHHLRVLRDLGLVRTERFRYWTYYRLEPAALAPLAERLGAIVAGAPEPATRRRPCC